MTEKRLFDALPIWVLNLERSTERRLFMVAQLAQLRLDYEIIPAVDGYGLSDNDMAAYSPRDALRCCGRELSPGEIGCALSHAKMWQRMVDENIRHLLVLEDDILIGEMFLRILGAVSNLPEDWEFINFVTDVDRCVVGEPICDIHRVCTFTSFPNRTGAYLLNQRGAKKLLDHVYPIRWPADGITGRTYITGLIAYGIEPQVAALNDFGSDIYVRAGKAFQRRSCRAKIELFFRKLINLQQYILTRIFKLET